MYRNANMHPLDKVRQTSMYTSKQNTYNQLMGQYIQTFHTNAVRLCTPELHTGMYLSDNNYARGHAKLLVIGTV